MNTIVVLTLVAWIATCLAIIHHSHLRRMAGTMLRHVIRSIRPRKALKD